MSTQISKEINAILNQKTSSILDNLQQMYVELNSQPFVEFKPVYKKRPSQILLINDPNWTIADRLVLVLINDYKQLSIEHIAELSGMTIGGTRKVLRRVSNYLNKIEGLYEIKEVQIY